ncbi:unnamed protein product, partial [Phaeothamnion confervicola]
PYGAVVAWDGEHCAQICCKKSSCGFSVYDEIQALCYLKKASAAAYGYVSAQNHTIFQLTRLPGPSVENSQVCIPNKRGIAYDLKRSEVAALAGPVSFFYNWSPTQSARGMKFYPMIWAEKDLARPPLQKTDILLGFNEPNFGDQSALTPSRAAALWPNVVRIAKSIGARIGSPAVNYCGTNCIEKDPIVWLDTFFAECKRLTGAACKVDYVAFHSYVCEVQYLNQQAHRYLKYGKPLMLTEFSCLDVPGQNASQQARYMKAAVTYLEQNPHVTHYAWFTGKSVEFPSINLFGERQLTPLGKLYKVLKSCTTDLM